MNKSQKTKKELCTGCIFYRSDNIYQCTYKPETAKDCPCRVCIVKAACTQECDDYMIYAISKHSTIRQVLRIPKTRVPFILKGGTLIVHRKVQEIKNPIIRDIIQKRLRKQIEQMRDQHDK